MTFQNFADAMIYDLKAKLVPQPHERRERGWINCRRYIIDLTSCSTYRHFSNTWKWYLLFVNDNFVMKYVLKIANWIYNLLQNNYFINIVAEVITIKTLFASAKPSAIADCQGEFWGLDIDNKDLQKRIKDLVIPFGTWCKQYSVHILVTLQ